MASIGYCTIYFLIVLFPCDKSNMDLRDSNFSRHGQWPYSSYTISDEAYQFCSRIRPTTRDLVKRFNSILPYFDKNHANTEFLRKFRATIYDMSHADDPLDKEVAYYAVSVTPLIFLQHYKNTWCILERFHRALHLYQKSHPTEKRPALKLLQNFRSIHQKFQRIISDLPVPTTTTESEESAADHFLDKKYIKEIIKNFG